MTPLRGGLIVAGGLLSAVSCSTAVVSPSVALAIAITAAPAVLEVGESFLLIAANAATGEIVNAQWSSSNPVLASVSDAQLTGLAPGRITITATYQGARATVSVKVVPVFAGTYPAPPDIWGLLFLVRCVNLSAEGNRCASNVGDTDLFRLQLTQTKDSVSGVGRRGTEEGTLTGEIDDLGRLSLRGTLVCQSTGGFPGYPCETIESWSSYLDAGGAMYGTYTSRIVDPRGLLLVQATWEMRGISHGP